MGNETYLLRSKASAMTFEFISKGPKGSIKKRVQYQKINTDPDIYNLVFGDINEETNAINDKIVSNNEDTQKVLATVAATILKFMNKYPNAVIYAKGSNFARTRLYQIGISNHLEEINQQFDVLGLLEENNLEVFEKNKKYLAFYIKNK